MKLFFLRCFFWLFVFICTVCFTVYSADNVDSQELFVTHCMFDTSLPKVPIILPSEKTNIGAFFRPLIDPTNKIFIEHNNNVGSEIKHLPLTLNEFKLVSEWLRNDCSCSQGATFLDVYNIFLIIHRCINERLVKKNYYNESEKVKSEKKPYGDVVLSQLNSEDRWLYKQGNDVTKFLIKINKDMTRKFFDQIQQKNGNLGDNFDINLLNQKLVHALIRQHITPYEFKKNNIHTKQSYHLLSTRYGYEKQKVIGDKSRIDAMTFGTGYIMIKFFQRDKLHKKYWIIDEKATNNSSHYALLYKQGYKEIKIILEHFERDIGDTSHWGFLDCSLMCKKIKIDNMSDCFIYCKQDEIVIYSDQWEPKISFPITFSDIISCGIYNKNVWICYKTENGTELSLHYFDEPHNSYRSYIHNISVKNIFQSNDPSIFTICTTDNKKIQYNIQNKFESCETEWLYFLNINPAIGVFFNCTDDDQKYWVQRYNNGHNHIFFESKHKKNDVQCLIIDMMKNPHEILFTFNVKGTLRDIEKDHNTYRKEIFCSLDMLGKHFSVNVYDESYQLNNYKRKDKFFNFYELSFCPEGIEKYFEDYMDLEEKDEESYYKKFSENYTFFLGGMFAVGLIIIYLYYIIQKYKNVEILQ